MQVEFYESGYGWATFLVIGFLILLLAIPILYGMARANKGVFNIGPRGGFMGGTGTGLLNFGASGTVLIFMGIIAAFFLGIGSYLYYEWTVTGPPMVNDYTLNTMLLSSVAVLIASLVVFSTVMIGRFAKQAYGGK